MKTKIFAIMMAIVMVLSIGLASAVNLKITELEANGKSLTSSDATSISKDYKRGQALDLNICVEALSDVEDAQIYADITGYDYAKEESEKVSDMTDTFELLSGHSDCFDLSLEVPTKIDKDYFKLRIRADDRNGTSVDKTYQLYLKGIDRKSAVEIKDFTLDPQEIIAGRAFTGKVKVKNLWDNTIKDLKVTMSVEDLNIKVYEYMDEIDSDKSKTFEELLLRVPECTKAGEYEVQIVVEYDEYRETAATGTINVKSSDTCGTNVAPVNGNTQISVPNTQEVAQGTSVVYPVVIANAGTTSQTYALSVSGASTWSTTRIDPSSVIVIPAGQTKTAYLYVSTNADAELGDKVFTLNIESGSDSKAVPLVAKITKTAGTDVSGFKTALEVGLVVLVIVLILVGLIIGFNKMKENKNDKTEPYY
jgi:uncharacterized membrane protein